MEGYTMNWPMRLCCLVCALALLSGCGIPQYSSSQVSSTPETEVMEEFQAPLFGTITPAILWGREQLDAHAQAAYDKMSQAIACRQETPLEVDADSQEIELVLRALRIDHPEYFWFDGEASFVSQEYGDVVVSTTCSFVYTMDADEIQQAGQQIQQYTAACLSSPALVAAQTDYEKILGVYRYLIDETDYVLTEEDQSILSVMADHRGTCAGYARSFQYLMSQLGIPCTLALGTGSSGQSHGWNMVQCDGEWYQMDVTWGDPVNPDGSPGTSLQYTYCLVTDQEIYRDHILDTTLPMPVCTATTWNYFIAEGLQFDTWDADAYEAALARAVENHERWFSVRFSNTDSYEAALEALLGDSQIMDMLVRQDLLEPQGQQSVTYTQNDMFCEISIALS
jgi:hypothetical protein